MFINSGAVKNSRKRKAKEEVEYIDLTTKDDDLTFPFTSFTSLLLQDDDDDDQHRIPNTHLHDQQIDQIIKTHYERLKRTLADQRRTDYTALRNAAEKRAAKLIREKEAELEQMERRKLELEQMVAHFRKEVQVWKDRVRLMEETAEYLREMLWKAKKRGGSTEEEEGSGGGGWRERLRCAQWVGGLRVEEDAESSYVDPKKGEGEMTKQVACKACGKCVATVLMWPCRHVAVCRRCEGATKQCPVCLSLPKQPVLKLFFPRAHQAQAQAQAQSLAHLSPQFLFFNNVI